eukprot:CAMPEP_0197606390 /NCGR_PEP_ID=MMETSP1326-20131121/44973_1 /TAXON_ID=1155430 /ORGANISM="Genus nov. species nov., Strain RCC2288" /LENGTH=50 /DNA_ID=CAMNT_0043174295 /DNA_START=269 /DNA_END=418 /DNA_ORIENTATION=-
MSQHGAAEEDGYPSSEDSSDDEFFDPEEDVSRSEPPSPSWLTRSMSTDAN